MSTNDRYVLNRMCDVALALGEAARANIRPTRIQLQKFVYLTDVLGQVVGLLKLQEAHKTFKAGPYDQAVQNAVDSLAFRELVRIAGTWRMPNGRLGTSYTLSTAGRHFLRRIQAADVFASKVKVARLVGEKIRVLGWKRIVDLVYAEPTYVATRSRGYGAVLEAENGLEASAAFLLALARRVVLTVEGAEGAAPEWLVEQFFNYLDDYDRNYGSRKELT